MDLTTIFNRAPLILVADDDWLNRDLLKTYLTSSGCEVMIAIEGQMALEQALRQPPDLALVDVQMPRLDGVERACLGVLVDWAERAMREGIIPKIDPWEAAVAFFGTATGIIQLFRGIQVIFSREALESIVRKTTWTLWRGLTTMQEPVS